MESCFPFKWPFARECAAFCIYDEAETSAGTLRAHTSRSAFGELAVQKRKRQLHTKQIPHAYFTVASRVPSNKQVLSG